MNAKVLLILVGSYFLITSCSKEPEKWNKDYFSYSLGAFINGVECHETSPVIDLYPYLPDRQYAFGLFTYATYYSIISMWDMHRLGVMPGNRGYKTGYYLKIEAAINIDSFHPYDPYSFNYTGIMPASFDHGEYQGEDIVRGLVVDSNNHVYYAKDGWIVFGEFNEQGKNSDKVTFEFIAYDDAGDSLVVTDGYCCAYDYEGI